MAWVDAWLSPAFLRPRVKPLGLSHSFRLQINSVNLFALGCQKQRPVSNAQRPYENPLNVLFEVRVNPIRKDGHIPELLVCLNIPRLYVCATTVVIRSDVSNALMRPWSGATTS